MTTLFALSLPLEVLGGLRAVGLSDRDIAEDREVQALVYLLDRAGANYRYRFKWDVFGPFSAELAEQVADFDDRAAADQAAEPSEAIGRASEIVRRIVEPPAGVSLSRAVWLRLLICVDFVRLRSHLALRNGDRPPFLAHNFSIEQIEQASAALRELGS